MTPAPALPRRELHVHLEGTVAPDTLRRIAARHDYPLPDDLEEQYRFTDFRSFLRTWLLTTNALQGYEDYRDVVLAYAAAVAPLGVVYVEGIFSPPERVERGARWDELFDGYCDGAQAAFEEHGVTVRLTPDLYRGVTRELARATAEWSVRYRERGVVGLGIGGHEPAAPLADYVEAFAIARDGGVLPVPHAGEHTDAAAVVEALELLDPPRIRHGIAAAADAGVVRELVARGTVLDVALTSNVLLGAVASYSEHPLPALVAAGVRCSLSTDDPAMFGTDIAREHEHAAAIGVAEQDLHDGALAGVLDPMVMERLR
ncbi:MAG TPA: adenosine deaminase [Mycobacteriales bacterium]|nr:adenosine deaminase [Mycobacteriales bacterium]